MWILTGSDVNLIVTDNIFWRIWKRSQTNYFKLYFLKTLSVKHNYIIHSNCINIIVSYTFSVQNYEASFLNVYLLKFNKSTLWLLFTESNNAH